MPQRPFTPAQLQAEKERRENICAAIVCDVLGNGAKWRRADVVCGPQGVHDFDIEFADGHHEAVEVCAFTEGPAEAQRAALEGNEFFESQILSRLWMLGVPDRGLDLRELRAGRLPPRIEAQLSVLESHGYDQFRDWEHWTLLFRLGATHPVVAVSAQLVQIGILQASSLPPRPGEPAAISLGVMSGGAIDPDAVNKAVEDRATESGNLKKLRAATHATSTHIFVPIYFGAGMTFMAVHHVSLSNTPRLPPDVNVAWVLGGGEGVLVVAPPGDWRRLPFSSVAVSSPEQWRA